MLYADDSKTSKAITSITDQIDLQTDLHRMYLWSQKWLLSFHPDKLKLLTIKTNKKSFNRTYFVGPYKVQNTQLEKDLGVEMDPALSFEKHIAGKVKKAKRMVGAIRRSFRYLDHDTFRLLYKSLVRCHLETSAAVWSPSSRKLIDEIESVQHQATKMLPGMHSLPYEERLRALKLPTLVSRRWRGDMIQVFKILKGFDDTEVSPALPLVEDRGYNLRGHPLNLKVQRSIKEIRRNAFPRRVINVWNSLDDGCKDAATVDAFKGNLDRCWANKDIIYNPNASIDD